MNSSAWAQPNILLIYVDDLGYGDLGSYGHPIIETPNIDALAASGLRLTQHYAASALCSPSRAALLTGRHPYRTGIKSWIPAGSGTYLDNQEVTLAEQLKKVGYRTALIGKWHLNSDLGNAGEPQPNDQGFDYFYGHNAFQIPTNRNPRNIYRNRTPLGEQQGYTAQLYADEALTWLQQSTSTPFFLMLSMAEPHTTIENPPAYNEHYAEHTQGQIVPIPSGEKVPPKHLLIPRGPGEYYANITYMDAQIGRVLKWLSEHPEQYNNTVVLFASDNGPVTSNWINWWEVNAYGSTAGLRGRKHGLYEGGIRVPGIIRYPGKLKGGTTSQALVIGADWFPTLLDWAGAPLPEGVKIDGQNVTNTLAGQTAAARDWLWALPTQSPFEFAWRQGDWKLLLTSTKEPYALYDLSTDPLELFDLRASQPEQMAKMQRAFNLAWEDLADRHTN